MKEKTKIVDMKTGEGENHYATEPIEALITAYLINQGNTLKIHDENERSNLVEKMIKGDKTVILGDYAFLAKDEDNLKEVWVSSKRIKKAESYKNTGETG